MEDYSVLLLQNLKPPPPPPPPHLYIRKSLIQHSLLLTCKASQNHNIPYGMFGGLVIEICIQDRTNTMGAYRITPAMGSHLVMYLAKMQENSKSVLPTNDVERFLLVVQGSATLTNASGAHHQLTVDSYAYPAPNFKHSLECDASATLAVFERRYASLENHVTEQIVGSTDQQPLLETPGKDQAMGRTIGQARVKDGLYILGIQSSNSNSLPLSFISVNSNKDDIWNYHLRLGHPSFKTL